MRLVILALIALSLSACATTQYRWEWDIDGTNKTQVEKTTADDQQCKDFAYRSKVAGSRYTELDIHISCMQRRGYALRKVAVGE